MYIMCVYIHVFVCVCTHTHTHTHTHIHTHTHTHTHTPGHCEKTVSLAPYVAQSARLKQFCTRSSQS